MRKGSLAMRLLVAFLAIFMFAGTIAAVLRFHAKLMADEYEMQKENLLDMAKLEASLIEVKLDEYITTLHTTAELMHNGELYTARHMEELNQLAEKLEFYQLGIITLDGILHDTHGEVDVGDRDYCQAVLRGETFVTGIITSRINGEKIITLAVPAYDHSGQLLGAIHGTISLDRFEPYTDTSLAVGNVNTYIFDRGGEYIIKNNKEGASWEHDNIFDHLEQAENGMPIAELRSTLAAGQSVTTEVVSGAVTYLCCFLPIRNGEWYALVDIPASNIDDYVSGVLDYDFYRMLFAIIIFAGFLCAVVLIWNHRRGTWERKREAELREKLMAQVVGFMVVDLDQERILSLSGRGLLREGKENTSYADYIADVIELGAHMDHKKAMVQFFSARALHADTASGYRKRSLEFLFRYMPDADYVWLECESILDHDSTTGHIIVSHILRDIDDRKQEEIVLRSEAERDMLTGLYNRSTGSRMIDHYLNLPDNADTHALILLDLDNFKTLNDTLGHQRGDQALMDVAKIVSAHFRKDDVICRLGGDEFVIFLRNIKAELAREKLDALLRKLRLHYEENELSVWIAASAGIVFTSPGDSFETLYRDADQALYQAKRAGKAAFHEFS